MTTTVPFWNDDPKSWDILRLSTAAGFPLVAPGIVEDIDPDQEMKIDKRDASGKTGASLAFVGWKLATVTVKMRIWNAVQFARIEPFLAEIRPIKRGVTPAPHDYSHPILSLCGLSALVFLSAKGPTHPGVKGVSFLTIKFIEFAPPPKGNVSKLLTISTALHGWNNELSAAGGDGKPVPSTGVIDPSTRFGYSGFDSTATPSPFVSTQDKSDINSAFFGRFKPSTKGAASP